MDTNWKFIIFGLGLILSVSLNDTIVTIGHQVYASVLTIGVMAITMGLVFMVQEAGMSIWRKWFSRKLKRS